MTTETLTVNPASALWERIYNDEGFRDANGGIWGAGRNGNRWLLSLTFRNLDGADLKAVRAHVSEARGQQNRMRVPVVSRLAFVIDGGAGGTPLLVGAHTAGATTLSIDGGSGTTDWLVKGDLIAVGNELKEVTTDVDLTAGAGTIEIWPELHQDYVDNTAVDVVTPHGDFVVISHSGFDIVPGRNGWLCPSVTLTLEEDTRA